VNSFALFWVTRGKFDTSARTHSTRLPQLDREQGLGTARLPSPAVTASTCSTASSRFHPEAFDYLPKMPHQSSATVSFPAPVQLPQDEGQPSKKFSRAKNLKTLFNTNTPAGTRSMPLNEAENIMVWCSPFAVHSIRDQRRTTGNSDNRI
jgi:hypothetical protein